MAYTTATHTRAISHDWLLHILGLFGTDTTNIMLGLKEDGIKTLFDFVGSPADELVDMEWPHEDDDTKVMKLTRADKRLLRNMHSWIIWVESTFPGINYSTLDMDDYEQFLMLRNMATVMPTLPTPTAAPLQIQIPPTPTQSQYLPTASFMPNVKLDVKQYSVFNGDGSSWMKFKRGVLSIASTHGLDDVFDETKAIPAVGDPDYPLFNEKNKFIY